MTSKDLPASADRWIDTVEAARRMGMSRTSLDAMMARCPPNLPGSPMRVGTGARRRHLRWDARALDDWLAAYRAWTEGRPSPVPASPLPAPRGQRRAKSTGAASGSLLARVMLRQGE